MDLETVKDEVNKYIPIWKIRQLTEAATNYVMNYTEPEAKVREATNEDQWGPTGPLLTEVTKYTHLYSTYKETMDMLWERMTSNNEGAWRRVYKSLLVLEHLIKHGPERVIQAARDHSYDLRSLQHFQHVDHKGKDQGQNIRHRAKQILNLIQDDSTVNEARVTAKANASKFGQGVGSGSGGGYGSTSGGFGSTSGGFGSTSGGFGSTSSGGGTGYDSYSSNNYDNYSNKSPKRNDGLGSYYSNQDEDVKPKEPEIKSNDNDFAVDWSNASVKSDNTEQSHKTTETKNTDNSDWLSNTSNASKKSTKPRKLVSLGAAMNYSAANTQKTEQPKAKPNNTDLLSGFDMSEPKTQPTNSNWDPFSDNKPETKAEDTFDPFGESKVKTENKTTEKGFDPFGDWLSNDNTQTAQPTQDNTLDMFSSMSNPETPINKPTNSIPVSQSANLTNLFSNLSTGEAPKVKETKIVNKSMGSGTWAGIGNLDSLVNQSSGMKKKSMNEIINLQKQTPKPSQPSVDLFSGSNIIIPSNTAKSSTNNDLLAGLF